MARTPTTTLIDLLAAWQERLQVLAQNGSLSAAAQNALDLEGEPKVLSDLVAAWAVGNFSDLPPVVLLTAAEINGAMGAYAISTKSIYLNADWILSASKEQVNAVLTEELGHHLDGLLNAVDMTGDEGEYFYNILANGVSEKQTRIVKSEDDRISITSGGHLLNAEASSSPALGVSDMEAPSIQGLSLAASVLDPSQPGGAFLSAELQFTDNLSGLDYASLQFSSDSGQSRHLSFYSDSLSGSRIGGTAYAATRLDPYTAEGVWSLESVQLRDRAGNSLNKHEWHSDWSDFLAESGISQTSFGVSYGPDPAPGTGPDSEAPSIQGLSLAATVLLIR